LRRDRVVKVAGELHEQLDGQARLGLFIFDVKDQLPTRAAAGYFFTQGDPRDAVLSAQRTRCVKCVGEKGDTAVAKGSGVCGERDVDPVAGDPAVVHQVCSAARISISLTATLRSRVTM